MAEPDWNRWHELLDIRDGRGLTPEERLEYGRIRRVVDRLDKEEEDQANAYNRRSKRWAGLSNSGGC